MPKHFFFFILLFLSSLILLSFFPGCLPVTPVTVTGTVYGYVALPDNTKDLTGYTPIPGATVTIVDADGVTHTVLTDENGYYYFNNISIKTNTIINITKDTEGGGKLIFKDIVSLAVSQEEDYDAGIADAESTAIALVVEGLVTLDQVQEEIDLDEITSSDGFDELKEDIQQAQEDNQDFTTDNPVNTQAEEVADNIVNPPEPTPTPDPDPSPSPSPTPTPTPATPITAIGAITGTAKVGVELTAGALTPSGATATYQWQICATSGGTYTNITGATSTTYTPVAGDATKFIKVVATGTGNYSGIVTSAATAETAAAVIDIAAITGVTAPVTGGVPVTVITETDQYTGTITWSPTHSPFWPVTIYTATITLTAKDGYTLTGITADFFNIAGATATNDAGSGVVTAAFSATGAIAIGDNYQGGKVAYIDGASGLIAAAADASSTMPWSNIMYTLVDTTGTAIGDGQTNTTDIVDQVTAGSSVGTVAIGNDAALVSLTVSENTKLLTYTIDGDAKTYTIASAITTKADFLAALNTQLDSAGTASFDASNHLKVVSATTGISSTVVSSGEAKTEIVGSSPTEVVGACISGAAYYCDNLDEGGYDDWFLPSKDELNKLYLSKDTVGGFTGDYYWSSSEYSADAAAWEQLFNDGSQNYDVKYGTYRVRAVRAF